MSVITHIQTTQVCRKKELNINNPMDQYLNETLSFSFVHSSIATNQLSIEQFYVCTIKQKVMPVDQVTLGFNWFNTTQCESVAKPIQSDSEGAIQKTETNGNDSTAKNESPINDMENLYWHTHGSMLWQR